MGRTTVPRCKVGLAEMFKNGAPTPAAPGTAKGVGKSGAAAAETPADVPPPPELLSLLGISAEDGGADLSASGLAQFHSEGHELVMPSDVHLMDVWIEGMSQPLSEGVAYLQFFAGGYTQQAYIHLTTTEGTIFTVKVAGLTGATQIIDSYVEAPR